MASGSLIFFTFDINLTYLVCKGQEELFRYYLDRVFCKKVKVSLYTFDFCFVNCCNTSQFTLLIGSRLLKLLVTWATNKLAKRKF